MPNRDVIQRLLKKVEILQNGCWLFTGWNDGKGYSKISINGKGVYVHRAMFEWFWRRKLRKGVQIDHSCCTRSCCNPLHLTPMMNKRNSQLREKRRKKL